MQSRLPPCVEAGDLPLFLHADGRWPCFSPTPFVQGETPVFADLPPCVEACDLALCRSWRSSSHPSRRGWLKEALFYLSSGDAPLTVQAISTTIRLPFNHRLLVQNLTFLVNMADIECSMTTMMSDNDDERVLFIIRLVYVFILFWLR
ncbi:uncharacterized protein LOC126410438 isoform X2 [Nymphaea colorata]|uniref:uncharacterized protein LOC126410438 isoform X2 n=1 Tax=Nymphaea colorata TaxID=210225 RepID=UPI00214ECE59|nr:uncharacterized protein LOC126410438 isoform X2 [Nymphaea colorata]